MAKIPSATESPWANGSWNRSWYEYMRQLGLGATEAELDAVIARVVALEATETRVQGQMSVQSFGEDTIRISLVGDTDTPGNTYFYGTSATGEKGWQALADALVAGPGIEIAEDIDTGALTLSHLDTSSLANFATPNTDGVVVQNITMSFDTFGHATSAFIETIDLDARYAPIATPGSSTGEILVADGISPPVMLTDEAATDFLYQG